jgi:hypothetical protein
MAQSAESSDEAPRRRVDGAHRAARRRSSSRLAGGCGHGQRRLVAGRRGRQARRLPDTGFVELISASRGRARTTALVSGMTRLTNCSAVPLTWGMAMASSPSAVWIGFGRVLLREPVAGGVRAYRARARKAVTSSSTARCSTSRAPSRPDSARCSPSSLSPLLSNPSSCASRRALGAILSIWRSLPLVVVWGCEDTVLSLLC